MSKRKGGSTEFHFSLSLSPPSLSLLVFRSLLTPFSHFFLFSLLVNKHTGPDVVKTMVQFHSMPVTAGITPAAGAESSAVATTEDVAAPPASMPPTSAPTVQSDIDAQARATQAASSKPELSAGERIFAEWLEVMRNAMQHDELRVLDLFRECDRNADGTVSKDELVSFLRRCGHPMSTAEIDAVMAVIDTDHNGQVDYFEFSQRVHARYSEADTARTAQPIAEDVAGVHSVAAATTTTTATSPGGAGGPEGAVGGSAMATDSAAVTIAAPPGDSAVASSGPAASAAADGSTISPAGGGGTPVGSASNGASAVAPPGDTPPVAAASAASATATASRATVDGEAVYARWVAALNEECTLEQRNALLAAFREKDPEGAGSVKRQAFRTVAKGTRPPDLNVRETNAIVSHLDPQGTMSVRYIGLPIKWEA